MTIINGIEMDDGVDEPDAGHRRYDDEGDTRTMREYMKQLCEQLQDGEAMHGPAYDAAIKRLSGGNLEAGARCSWCYADDLAFWGNPMPHPKDWFYHGLIVPVPDHDGRRTLEPDKCVVCVLEYPMEKENPEVDWTALLSVLTAPGLHRFHVMETVRTAMGRAS